MTVVAHPQQHEIQSRFFDPAQPESLTKIFFVKLRSFFIFIHRNRVHVLPWNICVLNDDLVVDLTGGGGELLAQDTYNLPRIQAGMHSRGFEGLFLGDQEIRIRHFHETLQAYIEERVPFGSA